MPVFITDFNKKNSKNFSRARRYGVLVPVTNKQCYPDDWEEKVQDMEAEAASVLKDFNFKEDYLLLAGDPAAIAVCVATVSAMAATRDEPVAFKCLKWDRKEEGYYIIEIEV